MKGFFREATGMDEDVSVTGTTGLRGEEEEVEGCDFPPSRKPLPLNGITFRISCDPEPER